MLIYGISGSLVGNIDMIYHNPPTHLMHELSVKSIATTFTLVLSSRESK